LGQPRKRENEVAKKNIVGGQVTQSHVRGGKKVETAREKNWVIFVHPGKGIS